ncbi:MAG: hypothetical protein JRI72_10810 [Deltaproteobacteria bacterium]|nr:hypothetical protein [Deltaproteobacteria bacterium]
MVRLRPDDVREMLQILEDGINLIPKLDKMDKIRVRSKIRKQDSWLSTVSDPSIDMIFRNCSKSCGNLLLC